MKVCYVTASSIPSSKAHSIQVMKMCAAIAGHGVCTELVIPRRRGPQHKARDASVDLWAWYGVPASFRLTRLRYPYPGSRLDQRTDKLAYALAAALYAATRRADLVYTRKLWVAYWLARWRRPVVLEVHDAVQDARHVAFERFIALARRAAGLRGIVAISQGAADMYIAAGAPPAKMRVLHDGVDLERFAAPLSTDQARLRLDLPRDQPIIGYVGNLYAGRGAELLLACARLWPQALFLLVGGEPADVARLRALCASQGIRNALLTGAVSNAEVPTYLYAADVLVMPYTSQVPHIRSISPLKMFEYMAAGRPIVSSDFATIREVLTQERNAVLVEPDRADTLLTGLQRVIGDPALAARIARQARLDVEPYSWSSRAGRILQWFAPSSSAPAPEEG